RARAGAGVAATAVPNSFVIATARQGRSGKQSRGAALGAGLLRRLTPPRNDDERTGPPSLSPSLRPRGKAEAGSNPEAPASALDCFVGSRLLAMTMNVQGHPPFPRHCDREARPKREAIQRRRPRRWIASSAHASSQ